MDNKRMEFLFLEHTYQCLVEGGILLLVVPQGRLDQSIPLLAENFTELRIFRPSDPELERFDQVALFGVRKKMRGHEYTQNRCALQAAAWRHDMPILQGNENFTEVHKREQFTNELALVYEDGRPLVLWRQKKMGARMQNAHLRFGRLDYRRSSGKTDTRISVYVDRYMGEGEEAYLISAIGGDAEIGTITAAIHEKHTFTLVFPDGAEQVAGLGRNAACYRGSFSLRGRKQTLRHLVSVSTSLHANGTAGRTFILHLAPHTRDLVWATLVSLLGLPADPRWNGPLLEVMWAEKKIRQLDGIGCIPAVIHSTREDLLARIRSARCAGLIPFPENNGPVLWPRYTISQALAATTV